MLQDSLMMDSDGNKYSVKKLLDNNGSSRDSADGSYARVDAHGFYWTATESDVANAWFYNFGKNGKILNRHQDGQKHMAISVRCVRNIDKSK